MSPSPLTSITGALPAIIILSALVTMIISFVLLAIYKRAVIRSMKTGAESPANVETPIDSANPENLPRLIFSYHDTVIPLSGSAKSDFEATSRELRQLGVIYGIAGAVYALILTVPWMLTVDDDFSLLRLLWLFICYAWPTVISLVILTATTSHRRLYLLSFYFAVVVTLAAAILTHGTESDIGQLLFLWLFVNGGPTLLVAAFLTRRIRAVGPLVLTFITAGVTGAVLFLDLLGRHDPLLRTVVVIGDLFALDATSLFVVLSLLGFGLLGLLGWWLLSRLGRAYRNKRLSDQSLHLDSLWLLFAVTQSITLTFEGLGWFLTGPIAFIAYKIITHFGFHRLSSETGGSPPSLLLLRVFALGRRSEKLFDHLSKRWLRRGSISMIAGPDLVTSTVEPHEFLDFMGGRLSRSFIDNREELERRMAQRDCLPDPDGRYRVNEFFCRQNTWRTCMQRLAAESRVILMDLRSFSAQNQGCLWELEQLLSRVDLGRVLFLVDETTERKYLEKQLINLWNRLSDDSPNRTRGRSKIQLFSIRPSTSLNADSLVKMLFAACVKGDGDILCNA